MKLLIFGISLLVFFSCKDDENFEPREAQKKEIPSQLSGYAYESDDYRIFIEEDSIIITKTYPDPLEGSDRGELVVFKSKESKKAFYNEKNNRIGEFQLPSNWNSRDPAPTVIERNGQRFQKKGNPWPHSRYLSISSRDQVSGEMMDLDIKSQGNGRDFISLGEGDFTPLSFKGRETASFDYEGYDKSFLVLSDPASSNCAFTIVGKKTINYKGQAESHFEILHKFR